MNLVQAWRSILRVSYGFAAATALALGWYASESEWVAVLILGLALVGQGGLIHYQHSMLTVARRRDAELP